MIKSLISNPVPINKNNHKKLYILHLQQTQWYFKHS